MTLNKLIAPLAALVCVAFVMAGTPAAAITCNGVAGFNPFIGTWAMNPAKSSFKLGAAPKSETHTTQDAGGGMLKSVVDEVGADGAATHWEATYTTDGKEYPVKGCPNIDTLSILRVDSNTIVITTKKGGKVLGKTTSMVSADLKTETGTTDGTGPDGKPAQDVVVYDRK